MRNEGELHKNKFVMCACFILYVYIYSCAVSSLNKDVTYLLTLQVMGPIVMHIIFQFVILTIVMTYVYIFMNAKYEVMLFIPGPGALAKSLGHVSMRHSERLQYGSPLRLKLLKSRLD